MEHAKRMHYKRSDWKLLAYDIDLTLTKDVSWTAEDALKAVPNPKIVQEINDAYAHGHIIILYTARRDALMSATFQWLKDHGIRFHGVNNQKLPADEYIDDKARQPDFDYGPVEGFRE